MIDTSTPTGLVGLMVSGIFLLLYGVRLLSDAMERAVGASLRRWTMRLAGRPLAALGLGGLATILTQSSGDLIDKQLMRLARRKRRRQLAFSDAGWDDLMSYHRDVTAALQQTFAALAAQDPGLAGEVLARKAWLHQAKRELHRRHLGRLREGVAPSLASSTIHLDLLTALSRVLSHASNIAHAVRGDL
jgi:Na+/phosphate symporter